MYVSHLRLANFRSYEELALEFGPGVNLFVGRNGQGKTNVVEAIRYLATLSSHRVANNQPLVHRGEDAATIRARVARGDRSLTLDVTISPGKATAARISKNPVRTRELIGVLRVVLFSPEDIDLVRGDPGGRRQLIDELAVALVPRRAADISDYERILKQRTTLLKTAKLGRSDLTTLDVWDEKLVTYGSRIIAARQQTMQQWLPFMRAAYQDVAPDQGEAAIKYIGSIETDATEEADIEPVFGAQLEALRAKEIERGVTLIGPHRDDVLIELAGFPAKGYASHGESWSCALALKLGMYDVLTSDTGPDSGEDAEPVLILDDVFAELDTARRTALAERVEHASQVFITAAVAEDVPENLRGDTFTVVKGRVEKSDAGLSAEVGADV